MSKKEKIMKLQSQNSSALLPKAFIPKSQQRKANSTMKSPVGIGILRNEKKEAAAAPSKTRQTSHLRVEENQSSASLSRLIKQRSQAIDTMLSPLSNKDEPAIKEGVSSTAEIQQASINPLPPMSLILQSNFPTKKKKKTIGLKHDQSQPATTSSFPSITHHLNSPKQHHANHQFPAGAPEEATMDKINLVDRRSRKTSPGRYYKHKSGKLNGSLSQASSSIDRHDLSRLSINQVKSTYKSGSYCTELWSDQLLPRVEAKPFGVPNLRQVLYIQRQTINRVEILIEVSKTDNGKFFIVVFQRYIRPGKSSSELFDDISVKEMFQLEAIQLLKKFGNDLHAFINQTVSFN